MLTHLRMKNFKAWEDTGDIRLAPLTLLFGGNSAGKTSIPHLLLMLRQTLESTDRQRVLHLGDGSSLVDLGTYQDIVFQHDTTRTLEFSLGWKEPEPCQVSDPNTGITYSSEELHFTGSVSGTSRAQPQVDRMEYVLGSPASPELAVRMTRKGAGQKYDLEADKYTLIRRQGRAWDLPAPYNFHGFPDEAVAYFQNSAFVSDLALRLQSALRSIYHVGPLREYPNRLYLWSGEEHVHVGQRGERVVEALLAAGERKFNFKPKERYRNLSTIIAQQLSDMGLIHSFSVKPIAAGRKEYEVLIQTHPKLAEVKLTDVGIGVSQVLPVLVECLSVPNHSVVIFEQPEIHLHPKVQADLADVFVAALKAGEQSGNNRVQRNVQFIIESHSEHFLRRLQRRIAEEALAPEQTAIYFVGSSETGAKINPLEIDAYGNVLNWPENFFGDEMADLLARSDAQARRAARRKGRS